MGREQLGTQGKGEDVGGAESAAAAVSVLDTSWRKGITLIWGPGVLAKQAREERARRGLRWVGPHGAGTEAGPTGNPGRAVRERGRRLGCLLSYGWVRTICWANRPKREGEGEKSSLFLFLIFQTNFKIQIQINLKFDFKPHHSKIICSSMNECTYMFVHLYLILIL